jgi:site-specific DNA recombinase
LDAGADPTVVTGWITEVQSQRRKIQEQLSTPGPQPTKTMNREQITTLIQQLGDITTALAEAEPTDRAEDYRQLGLRLAYHPEQQKVRVQAQPVADSYGDLVRVRSPS